LKLKWAIVPRTDIICTKSTHSKVQIAPTYMQNISLLKIADTVNVYPQAISRHCCDKNHQSGAQKHWDTQIISQPGGVNPTF
jgi:hypothetical protein